MGPDFSTLDAELEALGAIPDVDSVALASHYAGGIAELSEIDAALSELGTRTPMPSPAFARERTRPAEAANAGSSERVRGPASAEIALPQPVQRESADPQSGELSLDQPPRSGAYALSEELASREPEEREASSTDYLDEAPVDDAAFLDGDSTARLQAELVASRHGHDVGEFGELGELSARDDARPDSVRSEVRDSRRDEARTDDGADLNASDGFPLDEVEERMELRSEASMLSNGAPELFQGRAPARDESERDAEDEAAFEELFGPPREVATLGVLPPPPDDDTEVFDSATFARAALAEELIDEELEADDLDAEELDSAEFDVLVDSNVARQSASPSSPARPSQAPEKRPSFLGRLFGRREE